MRKLIFLFLALALPLSAEERRPYSVNAAFLYWWTNAPGLTYALESTNPFSKGKFHNPSMKPDVGFKVGAGYILPHDQWDLFLQLTHLHSRASVHKSAHGNKVLYPSWITAANQPNGYVDSVGGHWRLHFGFLDLELGRTLACGQYLIVRPFTGLRYAVVRQKYQLLYKGGTLFPNNTDRVYMTNKNLCLGLRSGLDIDWVIKKGWGIYSELAFSLLYGTVRVHQEEKVASETAKRFEVSQDFPAETGVVDMALGIEWQKKFREDRYRFTLQLGWEEHLFFGQNNFFRFIPPSYTTPFSSRESLDVEGIALNGKLEF